MFDLDRRKRDKGRRDMCNSRGRARATAGRLRSRFWQQKRLQKRLEVRKTERGERGLSSDYRIVESEPREEEICATYVGPTSWACKLYIRSKRVSHASFGYRTTVLLNLILASSRSTKFSTAVFWPLKSMFLRILQLY